MEHSSVRGSLTKRFLVLLTVILVLVSGVVLIFSSSMISAEINRSGGSAEEKATDIFWIHLLSVGLLLPTALFSYAWFLKKISVALQRVTSTTRSLSEGKSDFKRETEALPEFGELDRHLERIAGNIKAMTDRYQTMTQEVAAASYQMQSFVEKVGESASSQGDYAEKTAASARESLQTLSAISEGVSSLLSASEVTSSSMLEMSASISEISSQAGVLSSAVDTTSSSLIQMTSAIKEVSENADYLSRTAHLAVESVNRIDSSVKKVGESAKEAAQISEKVSLDAHDLGVRAIVKTIEGMKNIKQTVEKSSQVIHRLGKSSEDIGNILTVISEVKKQTNLLALNAAILAAQAGEQGKGFAVVADEIKKLADRTASSTNEISRLVTDVQTETKDAVLSINAGYEKVEEGMRLSLAAGDAVGKILESSKISADLARKIMEATSEQVGGIRVIKESVEKITSMSQEIVRATQEQNKGGEQIMDASIKMRDISNKLKASTQEQLQSTRHISAEAEGVSARVQDIVRGVDRQKQSEEAVAAVVSQMQNLILKDGQLANEMTGIVRQIIRQADLLNAGMDKTRNG